MFKANKKQQNDVNDVVRSDVFIVYFEHILYLFLVFLLLTLNKKSLARREFTQKKS